MGKEPRRRQRCRCRSQSKPTDFHRFLPPVPRLEALHWADTHPTSLTDMVLFCEQTHHQLHHGTTIRLKDGRWLNHSGWTDSPPG